MTRGIIPCSFGRQTFGEDPAAYDKIRPPYPAFVFETLSTRCGLSEGVAVFEIGAGTGTATRELLASGADPVVAIEPDPRLAQFLAENSATPALHVVNAVFEDTSLGRTDFDLGVCATAFHWLDEASALVRVADLLRPAGWWAMVWNVFQDPGKADPFHEATKHLLEDNPTSPTNAVKDKPFPLDADARMDALRRSDRFSLMDYEQRSWPLVLNSNQAVALYATYSNIAALPGENRRSILTELRRIAEVEFGGRVIRNMVTILYIARRD